MMTLRDELAAVLGPGNNDLVAYDQADAVLNILLHTKDLNWEIAVAIDDSRYGPYAPDAPKCSHWPS